MAIKNLKKSSSLKKDSLRILMTRYPKLNISWKQEYTEKFTSDKSYLWIGGSILILFMIIFFKNISPIFSCLNIIKLTKETAEKILENRIGNIATMVGFSLSIATFLITNTEKKGKENREVLIKRTYLYPTLYLALVILFFYIIVSFCKDTLPTHLFFDFVIFLHYLLLFLIVAIVFLFRNIIHIFNPNYTDSWLEENVILSVKQGLKKAILEEISSQLYEIFINGIDSKNLNTDSKMRWETSERQVLKIPDSKEIADIDLVKLKKVINKHHDTEIYPSVQSLHIYAQPSYYLSKHLFSLSKINERFKNDLLEAFKFEKPSLDMLSFQNYQISLKKRLSEAIKKDNEDDFETVFNIYEAIFNTFFDITKDSKAANPQYKVGYNLLHSIQWDIEELLNEAIAKDNSEFFSDILNLIEQNIYRAFNNRQMTPFVDYLAIYTRIYPKILYKESCSAKILRDSFGGLQMIHDNFLNQAFEDSESIADKQIINSFLLAFYNAYAQLLYGIISVYSNTEVMTPDLEKNVNRHFKQTLEDLDKIVKSFNIGEISPLVNEHSQEDNEAFLTNIIRERLGFRTQFTIKSWITHLYRFNKIKDSDYQDFIKDLYLHTNYHFSFVNEAMELLSSTNNLSAGNLRLSDWGYITDDTQRMNFRTVITQYWLQFGFVAELFNHYNLIDSEFDQILINSPLRFYKNEITKLLFEIKNNYSKWQNVLNLPTLENFRWHENNILSSLKKLEHRHISYLEEVRAEQPFSTEKLEIFRGNISKNWKSKSSILHAFEYLGAIKPIIEDHEYLESMKTSRNEPNIKMIFVDNEYVALDFSSQLTNKLRQITDNYFYQTTVNGITPEIFSNPFEAIKNSITKLKNRGREPNIIFISESIIDSEGFAKANSGFVHNWQLKEGEKSKIGVGLFLNIPIVTLSNGINYQIITADLKQAFELEILENNDWIEKRLYSHVESFSREEAINEYEKNRDKWKMDKEGNELSFEEAINTIRNIVKFELSSKLRINMLDKEAFDVTSFDKFGTTIPPV